MKQHISSAYAKGIIKGYSEEIFAPDEFIKRQDVVVIMMRALEKNQEVILSNFEDCTFVDKLKVYGYAKDYVASSVKYQSIIGNDTKEEKAHFSLIKK